MKPVIFLIIPLALASGLGYIAYKTYASPSIQPHAEHHARINAVAVVKDKFNVADAMGWIEKDQYLVNATFGKPYQKLPNSYGLEWHIYHKTYESLKAFSFAGGKIEAALFLHDFGVSRVEVRAQFGKEPLTFITHDDGVRYKASMGEYMDTYLLNGFYMSFYYDTERNFSLQAISAIKKEIEESKKGYYGTTSEQIARGEEQLFLHLTNAIRVMYGIPELQQNQDVSAVALSHSQDMIQQNYYSHFDKQGGDVGARLKRKSVEYIYAGENLAHGAFHPLATTFGFLNSPAHRKVLLYPAYTDFGAGIVYKDGSPYVTTNYIRP